MTGTPSFGYSGSGSYFRQQTISNTPTPLPSINQTGLLLTIAPRAENPGGNEGLQYVMSLDEDAFLRSSFTLQDNMLVQSPSELPVLVGQLVNAYGLERGIEIYNEIYGSYLPLIPAEEALIDGEYEVTPLVDIAQSRLRNISEKTFILQDDVYTDSSFEPDSTTLTLITMDSPEYDALVVSQPELVTYLSAGVPLIITWEGTAYEIQQN